MIAPHEFAPLTPRVLVRIGRATTSLVEPPPTTNGGTGAPAAFESALPSSAPVPKPAQNGA